MHTFFNQTLFLVAIYKT